MQYTTENTEGYSPVFFIRMRRPPGPTLAPLAAHVRSSMDLLQHISEQVLYEYEYR